MQRLSAIDAIAPAFSHTSRLLLTARNWRTLLKVCAVAFFAQMGGCNLNFNSPGHLPHSASSPFAAGLAAILVIGVFIVLLVGLALFYVGSRLQFVLFQVVLRQHTRIAPMWAGAGRVVWRWIGLKAAFFLVALLCTMPVLLPMILHFAHSVPGTGAPPANPLAFISTILGFIAAVFVVVLIFSIAYLLLLDFGLPSMALEDTTLSETLHRILRFIRQEPGQVALYVLMRFLLAFGWALASYLAIAVITLILLIPLGGIGYLLYASLHHAGAAAHLLMFAGWAVLGLILASVVLVAFLLAFGFCFTFLQAYAIYFLAGRYPLLASLLEPGPGQPFTPPPVFPSPEESSDDIDPPFPMDPALA